MKPRITPEEDKKQALAQEVKRFKATRNKDGFRFSTHFKELFPNRKDADFLKEQKEVEISPEFMEQFKKIAIKPAAPQTPRGSDRATFSATAPPTTSRPITPPRAPETPRSFRERRTAPVPPPIPTGLLRKKSAIKDEKAVFSATVRETTPKAPAKEEKQDLPPLVTGAEKLGDPPIPPRGNDRHYFQGTVIGNRLYLADKPFGMEPGSLVMTINEDLVKYLIKGGIIEQKTADEYFKMKENLTSEEYQQALIFLVTSEMNKIHEDLNKKELRIVREEKKLPPLEKMVKKQKQGEPPINTDKLIKLANITKELKSAGMGGTKKMSLLKQTYTEKSIAPPIDRLRNTKRGENKSLAYVKVWEYAKKKKSSRQEENANAIGETFGNAIAGAFAMPSQKQYMLLSSYEDGSLKIITDCEWQPGLQGMTGQVAGQQYQGYFVKTEKVETVDGTEITVPVKTENDPPYYRSSLAELKHASQNLALFLIQADDDGFGSQLQNKMILDEELYGIDFGHAYRDYGKGNPLIDNLSVDFTLDDKTQKKYKNISILLDAPITDKMLGVFYTYKSMDPDTRIQLFGLDGVEKIEAAIKQYEAYYKEQGYPQFAEKMSQIQEGGVDKILKAYETSFQTLIEKETQLLKEEMAKPEGERSSKKIETLGKRITELDDNLKILRKKAEYHKSSSEKMLYQFKERMQLSPSEITLLNNLSKLTSETRSTDNSGTVALNHLQILENNKRVEWDLKPEGDTIQLTAKIPAGASVDDIKAVFEGYAKAMGTDLIRPEFKEGGIISLSVPKDKMAEFSALLAENNIQKIKPKLNTSLHKVPNLIAVNEKAPGSANVVRSLSLLTSVTSKGPTGELYPLQNKNTNMQWEIKEQKNNQGQMMIEMSANVPKNIKGKDVLKILNKLTENLGPPPIKFKSHRTKTGKRKLKVVCNYDQLVQLKDIFNEDNVKKIKTNPVGEVRQLVLSTRRTDNIVKKVPELNQLFANLKTLATITSPTGAVECSASIKRGQNDQMKEVERFALKITIPEENKQKFIDRLKALDIAGDYRLVTDQKGQVIIECDSKEKLKEFAQAINQHQVFKAVNAERPSVSAPPPVARQPSTASLPAKEKKQTTSLLQKLLGLKLQKSQNNLKVDEVPETRAKSGSPAPKSPTPSASVSIKEEQKSDQSTPSRPRTLGKR